MPGTIIEPRNLTRPLMPPERPNATVGRMHAQTQRGHTTQSELTSVEEHPEHALPSEAGPRDCTHDA